MKGRITYSQAKRLRELGINQAVAMEYFQEHGGVVSSYKFSGPAAFYYHEIDEMLPPGIRDDIWNYMAMHYQANPIDGSGERICDQLIFMLSEGIWGAESANERILSSREMS